MPVRPVEFIGAAYKKIAVKCLHIDQAVWRVVDGIDAIDECPVGVGAVDGTTDVGNGADGV